MEPLTAAMTLAQLVSLLNDYVASRSSRDALNIQDLAAWAATHGHADVMAAIERNHATSIGVKAALAEGRDELLAKLNKLDEDLAALAAGLGPLDVIARELRPANVLSDKAREILREFERSGATSAIEHRNNSRGDHADFKWVFLDALVKVDIEMDRRFYDDDVQSLLDRALVTAMYTPKGTRSFKLTRRGSSVAQQLLKASATVG